MGKTIGPREMKKKFEDKYSLYGTRQGCNLLVLKENGLMGVKVYSGAAIGPIWLKTLDQEVLCGIFIHCMMF